MTARNYPNWLAGYAHYTRHSEAPDLFHFWTGVFTIAGALRRQVWIDQRYFQWTPNFYVILVGPAGVVTKSTSLGIGTDLLHQLDGVHFGPDSMTWQGLTSALEEANDLVPIGDDYTPMSCITCSISELGTFLRPEDKTMMDVLVDLWDGRTRPWSRRTRGAEGQVKIENPWINVMGCTTPSWIRDNIPESMIGGGLISRIVFVYADKKRHLVPYPADLYNLQEFSEQRIKLIDDLSRIAGIVGEYTLTKEAKTWGIAWYEKHWTSRPEHMISERFEPYLARKQTHIHKLAIVLAAAQRDELVITEDDLRFADQMVSGLEASMQTVFQSIGVGDISRLVTELLTYVRAYKEISQLDLWRYMMPIMSVQEFDEAIGAAVKAGYLRVVQRPGPSGVSELRFVAIYDKKE